MQKSKDIILFVTYHLRCTKRPLSKNTVISINLTKHLKFYMLKDTVCVTPMMLRHQQVIFGIFSDSLISDTRSENTVSHGTRGTPKVFPSLRLMLPFIKTWSAIWMRTNFIILVVPFLFVFDEVFILTEFVSCTVESYYKALSTLEKYCLLLVTGVIDLCNMACILPYFKFDGQVMIFIFLAKYLSYSLTFFYFTVEMC